MNYFDHPAMSQSKLKDLKKSPKYFWAKHINIYRDYDEETKDMRFGTAFHTLLQEPEKFRNEYIFEQKFDKRTVEGKEKAKSFELESTGKIILTYDESKYLVKMRDSVLSKKVARILLNGGDIEAELYWKDQITGIACKLKGDRIFKPGELELFPNGLIIDIKTTKDVGYEEFSKSIYKFGYYNQWAWYEEGYFQNYGTRPNFIFIAVEKTEPFDCCFFTGDETMLEIGRQENRKLLNLYNECLNKNSWPGYPDRIETIGLPAWAINKFNFEEE